MSNEERITQLLEYSAAFREMAEFLQAHPSIPPGFASIIARVYVPTEDGESFRAIARKLGNFEKVYSGDDIHAEKAFGPVRLVVYAPRSEVCKRIVTGTRIVAEQVVPARAEEVIPEHEEEVVEWDCGPILAPPTDAEAKESAEQFNGSTITALEQMVEQKENGAA